MRLFESLYFCDIKIMHIVLSGAVRANNQWTELLSFFSKQLVLYCTLFLYELQTEPLAKARESQRAGGLLAGRITNISDLIFLYNFPGGFN